nr:MAG TPA: hypothetical protein [Caudoviricetes sp.]
MLLQLFLVDYVLRILIHCLLYYFIIITQEILTGFLYITVSYFLNTLDNYILA